jgi:putative membrane protein
MIATLPEFHDAVTRKVHDLERQTDAEIVVVVAPSSLDPRLMAERAATLFALLIAILILWVPHTFQPAVALIDLGAAWFFARWITLRTGLASHLAGPQTRHAAAHERAQRVFFEENLHGTPRRTGVLVFVSHAESQVILLTDLGVQGAVPEAELARARDAFHHHDLAHFLAGLDALGAALARHLPHRHDSDATDLPDAPRVLA